MSSSMNFMEKLLDGVEVEWKALGEIGELVRGNGLQKKDFTEIGVPAIHYGQIYTYYGFSTTETKSFVSPELAKKLRKVNTGDVVITNTSENLEDVGKALVYLGVQQAVTGGHATIFKPSGTIIGKYFAYFTQTTTFSNEKRKYAKGAKVIDVSATDMAKIQIPIPCPENQEKSLEIQAEIVRILDAFTALTTELTTELTARKKQYNYYRDRLLSFEEGGVEWKTLGKVTLPTSNIRWRDTNRTYRYIDLTSVSRENNAIIETSKITAQNAPSRAQKLVEKDDVIFATTRPTQLRLSLIDEEYSGEVASTGYCVLRAKSCEVLPKWIYYYLSSTEFGKYVEENQSGSAYPAISDSKVKEFKLPIPYPSNPKKSLAEQARIVAILDKFDSLTHSISEGLPREIELRQKQYEYYRDLLLSFPKPEEVTA
ncbi:restriction endonuclease subunit S [Xenorhabdus kozodoii]|uniref:Putative restriction modification enzyme S subunit n=1 Tax=Xenorhabdus kozodoii TaxID=351676 RepID=A0A2D0L865_9GAMM|nr:restriction endonuclease subunit S [Xenorhabdus kozodoii]PHM71884.1 putative restriction modification enzyme S subunit [Xenorhabdus kozodoii]